MTPYLMQYLKLRALQRQSFTHYFYEATVGAGLPIMHTLRDLLQTGDKIIKIEGIFRSIKQPYYIFRPYMLFILLLSLRLFSFQ